MFILKIIGIILLILLGLLLFTIGAVLFVPIRYVIAGENEEELSVQMKVTWLLHLIVWKGNYQDKEFTSSLRILGIHKKDKPVGTDEDSSEEEVEASEDETSDVAQEEAMSEEESEVSENETGADAKEESGWEEESLADEARVVAREETNTGLLDRIKKFIREIRDKLRRIRSTFIQIKDKAAAVKEVISDERNQRVAGMIFGELKYLLCHFKFRRIDTDLTFSLGDPAATGQLLGALATMPFLYRYQCNVYPDFEAEDAYVKGTFCIKGKVRIVHILISGVRLFKEKEFRAVLKKFLDR